MQRLYVTGWATGTRSVAVKYLSLIARKLGLQLSRRHMVVPNNDPIPTEIAIDSELQKVTLTIPAVRLAPPV